MVEEGRVQRVIHQSQGGPNIAVLRSPVLRMRLNGGNGLLMDECVWEISPRRARRASYLSQWLPTLYRTRESDDGLFKRVCHSPIKASAWFIIWSDRYMPDCRSFSKTGRDA